MTGGVFLGVPAKTWRLATLAGLAIGCVYALSPLMVWFALGVRVLFWYAASGSTAGPKDEDEVERRWVIGLLACGIVLRVIAVAALFATTDHFKVAFGTFFGDEEYYLRRAIWLRNVALRLPVHSADLVYAFDDSGRTSHLYVLAFLQTLVGPAPYGVRLVGILLYLAGAILLYRLVRPGFGRGPALTGLALLLFLPTQFAWSISALKEPLFFLGTVSAIGLAVVMVRHRLWPVRLLGLAGLVVLVGVQQTVRDQGGLVTGAGVLVGVLVAWLVSRPRVLLAVIVAAPLVTGAVLGRPEAQLRAYRLVQAAARVHWGHVETRGWVYTLLDPRFYSDISAISDMQFVDTMRYLVRAAERYVTVPLPWEAKSATALAYLPEQMIWYSMVALLPFGVVCSFRRDALVASLLAGTALVAAAGVALTNGNVGTVVRHRGLAIPYLVWLSLVGVSEMLSRGEAAREPV